MKKTLVKSLAFGISTCLLSTTPQAATMDLSLLNNPDGKVQVLAAKDISKKLTFQKPGYSFVFSWNGNSVISNFERDERLFKIQGTGHTAEIYMYDYKRYSLSFAARYKDELEKAMYTDARRYPFQGQSKPGLSFDNNGGGCNELSGKFKVLEIEKDIQGNLTKFAADFEHHCEMSTTPTIGSIRFNSSLPSTSSPAIIYNDALIVPLFKIKGDKDTPQYRSMVLHRVSSENFQIDSIFTADNSNEDGIQVPAGYNQDLGAFVIPSLIEVSSSGAQKEFEVHFEKLPDELIVGKQLKIKEMIQTR